jgi:hypothetical protein
MDEFKWVDLTVFSYGSILHFHLFFLTSLSSPLSLLPHYRSTTTILRKGLDILLLACWLIRSNSCQGDRLD